MDHALDIGKQIAVLFETDAGETDSLLQVIRSEYRLNVVVAASKYPSLADAPALLLHRSLKGGKSTAYVCDHFVCKQPVNMTHDLLQQL